MKAFLPSIYLLLSLVSAASASAFEKVDVKASPDYRVALLGSEKPNSNEKACYKALGTSLAADMSLRYGGRVNVRLIEVDAIRAAADLATGNFDAVVVVGDNLPATLRKPEFVTTREVSEMGVPVRVFQLVVRNDDPALQATVVASFEKALSAPPFLEALSRAVAMKVSANTR